MAARKRKKSPKNEALDHVAGCFKKFQESRYDKRWHRQPTLVSEDWRDGVNKQLDALTDAMEFAIALHAANGKTLEVLGETQKLQIRSDVMGQEILKQIAVMLGHLALDKHEKKKGWKLPTIDLGKLQQAINLSKTAADLLMRFFGGHPGLPPKE